MKQILRTKQQATECKPYKARIMCAVIKPTATKAMLEKTERLASGPYSWQTNYELERNRHPYANTNQLETPSDKNARSKTLRSL